MIVKDNKPVPIFFAKDIPQDAHKVIKDEYGPFEPDWRPKQMHGLPRMLSRSLCGCYMHYASNYSEWIMCPVHAAAPKMKETLEAITTFLDGLDPEIDFALEAARDRLAQLEEQETEVKVCQRYVHAPAWSGLKCEHSVDMHDPVTGKCSGILPFNWGDYPCGCTGYLPEKESK